MSTSKARIHLLVTAALVTSGGIDLCAQSPAGANQNRSDAVRSAVTRYMTAVQKGDYATVVELNGIFAAGELEIRQNNPQALWTDLIQTYRQSKMMELEHKRGPELGTQYIVESVGQLQQLLPPTSKWSIMEIRHEQRSPNRNSTMDTAYLSIIYSERKQAPTSGGVPLKKMIISLGVIGPAPFLMGAYREVAAGKEFWWDSGKQ